MLDVIIYINLNSYNFEKNYCSTSVTIYLCLHYTSGVTIGSGVDLGSKNRRYFEDLNVPSEIIDKLEPYFGLKTEDAKAKLQEIQLTLTDEEARDLSEKVTIKMLKDLENNYNNAIGRKTI